MNLTTFTLTLFGLQAICLIVGGRSSKELSTQDDYFLAGKSIRFFPLMMTFLATQVGGGLILGSAEEAYQFGWIVLLYPLGVSLGLIVLGLGIGRKLALFNISTVAQIFEVVYKSTFLKKVASILSIVTLFMIFTAQVVGSNKFMISLGIENKLWFIGFWAIVIFYTAVGGLKAVIATDIIQAAFFVVIFLLTLGYATYVNDINFLQVFTESISSENFVFDSSKLYGWLLMPLLFMVIEQDMGQRCFAGDSPRTVSKATLWAGICTLIVSIVPVFFGILAKDLGINIPEGASVLMISIMATTNPIITALIACAILAAIISTADSLINAIGSNLSQDFKLSLFSEKNIRASQYVSVGISLAGIILSFYFNNIVDLLIQSYELSVSCLFIPICLAIFRHQGNTLSATLSIIFGATCFFLFKVIPVPLSKELLTLLVSLVGYGLGELLVWKKTQEEKTEMIL